MLPLPRITFPDPIHSATCAGLMPPQVRPGLPRQWGNQISSLHPQAQLSWQPAPATLTTLDHCACHNQSEKTSIPQQFPRWKAYTKKRAALDSFGTKIEKLITWQKDCYVLFYKDTIISFPWKLDHMVPSTEQNVSTMQSLISVHKTCVWVVFSLQIPIMNTTHLWSKTLWVTGQL